jgi:hypothetical protein
MFTDAFRSAWSCTTLHSSFGHRNRRPCRSPRSPQHEHVFELFGIFDRQGKKSPPGATPTAQVVRRWDRACRISAQSRSLSGQFGQTRVVATSSGVKTRTYCYVAKEPQFWHSGIRSVTLVSIKIAWKLAIVCEARYALKLSCWPDSASVPEIYPWLTKGVFTCIRSLAPKHV